MSTYLCYGDKSVEKLTIDLSKPYFTTITTVDAYTPLQKHITYIHRSNCPNCGGLLDASEDLPSVKCKCCGTKVWSIREVVA